jgi:pimeloyl-ACP methyl ester carboxylesterase
MKPREWLEKTATNIARPGTPLAVALRAVEPLGPNVVASLIEPLVLLPPSHPRPAKERELLSTAHRFRIRHAGRSLAAWSWGDGPTIVGLHGWGGRGGQFATYAAPLVEAGYSVVLFDAPGHGESDGRLSSLPQFADALESVLQAVRGAHAVLAHSMGAAAAVLVAARGAPVERLVLFGTPTSFTRYARHFQRSVGMSDRLFRALQHRLEARFRVRWEEIELESLAQRVQQPTLFVHDANDKEAKLKNVEPLLAHWPSAELLKTEGLGHYRILWDAAVRDAVLRFLQRGR